MVTLFDDFDAAQAIKTSGHSMREWQRMTGINRNRLKRIELGSAIPTPSERLAIAIKLSSSRHYVRRLIESLGLGDEISEDKWEYVTELADNLPRLFCGLVRLESPIELVPPRQVVDFVVRKIDERSKEIAQRRKAEQWI